MKAIYASKLYRASSRQESIRAAINNPVNADLVKQIRTYLEDDEIDETGKAVSPVEMPPAEDVNPDDGSDNGNVQPEIHPVHSVSPQPAVSEVPNGDQVESPDTLPVSKVDDDTDDTKDDPVAMPDAAETPEAVASSTKITASADRPAEYFSEGIDVLKGTLNSRDDTSGVSRVELKNDEIWLYYNDSVNLNNVMDAVITFMNAGYDYVEFNRLARSNNAIVFTVTPIQQEVQAVVEDK